MTIGEFHNQEISYSRLCNKERNAELKSLKSAILGMSLEDRNNKIHLTVSVGYNPKQIKNGGIEYKDDVVYRFDFNYSTPVAVVTDTIYNKAIIDMQ